MEIRIVSRLWLGQKVSDCSLVFWCAYAQELNRSLAFFFEIQLLQGPIVCQV